MNMIKPIAFYLKIFFLCLFILDCSQLKKPFLEEVDNLKIDSLAPFYHGVASGDPLENKVIIWTRVTPKNYMKKIPVSWKVSEFSDFRNIHKNGEFITDSDRDFSKKNYD